MYEKYWGLQEKPFENTPDPRFLFHSDDIAEVFTRLLYALKNNRGAAMLTGGSSCGKTLMARALVQEFDPETAEVALLTNPRWNPDEFLREILYQLGEESSLENRAQIVHRLNEVVFENFSAGRETIVLIDEGQLLEDPDVFEEIRLLLNFQLNGAFLIHLLLVGQSLLAVTSRPSRLRLPWRVLHFTRFSTQSKLVNRSSSDRPITRNTEVTVRFPGARMAPTSNN